MSTRPAQYNEPRWVIWAIPSAVVVVLVAATLIILAVRPEKRPANQQASLASPISPAPRAAKEDHPAAPPPAETKATPAPAPTPANSLVESKRSPPAPTPSLPPANTVASAVQSNNTPSIPVPAPAPTTPAPAPKPPAPKVSPAVDLLPAVKIPDSVVAGEWTFDNGVLKCTNGSGKNRARIRLIDPPDDQEYDFSVTFTVNAGRAYFCQICSFKGHQFNWAYLPTASGFAQVGGKSVLQNPSTVRKGIRGNQKYTSVIKVRKNLIAAYLDGELYSSYTTDFNDLSMANMWHINDPKAIGIATETPTDIFAISISGPDGAPINIPNLAPSKAAVAENAAPAKPSPINAYKQLAEIITNSYSTQSSAAATQPSPRPKPFADALKEVVDLKQEGISNVAQDLLNPPPKTDDAFFAAVVTVAGKDESKNGGVRPGDPLGEHIAYDEPPLLIGNVNLLPENATDRAAFDLEQARLAAWQKLIGQMTQIYPNAKPTPGVIKVAITGHDSFAATSSAPLTNVTLALDIVRVTTSPSVTGRQYYFIPNMAAGKKIYLPTRTPPNVSSPQLLARAAPPPMWGVGGMLEARVQVWSNEATQDAETIKFDTNVEPIAKALIADAYAATDDIVRRPAAARNSTTGSSGARQALLNGPVVMPRVTLAETTPAIVQAHTDAKKVLDLVPSDSTLATEAKAIDTDPQNALRDLRKKQLDEFIAALPQGKQRAGVWAVKKPGLLVKLSSPNGRTSAVNSGGDRAGKVTMLIDARTPEGSATVTLFNPDQPTVRRKVSGHIQVDNSSNRLLLQLKSPPTSPKQINDADLKVLNNWTRMLLELHNETLRGIVEVGTGDNAVTLNIAFDQPQDVPKK